jgi:hypothetical protein
VRRAPALEAGGRKAELRAETRLRTLSQMGRPASHKSQRTGFDSLSVYQVKIIANYASTEHPPLLTLYIHDAPHRRMHIQTIVQYRQFIRDACAKAGIATPMEHPIDLSVLFVNPSTPDLGQCVPRIWSRHLMDQRLKAPGIVTDDGLIQKVTMSKYFNAAKKK